MGALTEDLRSRLTPGMTLPEPFAKHFYSVPHDLLRQEVEARITASTVELFHRGKRVARHLRSAARHPSTVAEHMPSAHRRYREWTHERIRREAAAIGGDTATLADLILRSRPHPEQGFRTSLHQSLQAT